MDKPIAKFSAKEMISSLEVSLNALKPWAQVPGYKRQVKKAIREAEAMLTFWCEQSAHDAQKGEGQG